MLTFTAINISHAKICAQLDSLCFDSEVFDLTMIQSLLSTPYVSGCLAMEGEDAIGYALFPTAGAKVTCSPFPFYQTSEAKVMAKNC